MYLVVLVTTTLQEKAPRYFQANKNSHVLTKILKVLLNVIK